MYPLTEHTVRLFLSGLFAATVAAAGMHYIATGAIHVITEATRAQCAAQDWPAHQHQAHLAFCEMEGYPVGVATRE